MAETLKIDGVQVQFPLKPYRSQVLMMKRIVQALNEVCGRDIDLFLCLYVCRARTLCWRVQRGLARVSVSSVRRSRGKGASQTRYSSKRTILFLKTPAMKVSALLLLLLLLQHHSRLLPAPHLKAPPLKLQIMVVSKKPRRPPSSMGTTTTFRPRKGSSAKTL
jgi:hypothetical protein